MRNISYCYNFNFLKTRPWDIDQSIFAHRKTISDCRSYNDIAAAWSTRFKLDWQRVVSTQRFDKLISKELTQKELGGGGVVGPLRDLCEAEYPNLMAAFNYYSASDGDMGTAPRLVFYHAKNKFEPCSQLGDGGTACFSIRENAYMRFLLDIIGGDEKRQAAIWSLSTHTTEHM